MLCAPCGELAGIVDRQALSDLGKTKPSWVWDPSPAVPRPCLAFDDPVGPGSYCLGLSSWRHAQAPRLCPRLPISLGGDRPPFRGGSDCARNHSSAGGSSDCSTAPRRAGSQQLSGCNGGSQARPSLAGHPTFAAFPQAAPTSDGVVAQPWCRTAQRAVRAGQAAAALPGRKRSYSVPLATAARDPSTPTSSLPVRGENIGAPHRVAHARPKVSCRKARCFGWTGIFSELVHITNRLSRRLRPRLARLGESGLYCGSGMWRRRSSTLCYTRCPCHWPGLKVRGAHSDGGEKEEAIW